MDKIRMKVSPVLFIVIGVMVAITLFGILGFFISNRCYRGYSVVEYNNRRDSNTAQYMSHDGKLLKYSRDGASGLNAKGDVLWNGGYEMERPTVDICEKYVVIADVGGKDLYVYNGEDSGTKLEMDLPIVKARVAAQGVVAVLLQGEEKNVINIYNPYSTVDPLLVEIPTNVNDDGYAMDFDISPDANSLVASYLTVTEGKINNNVMFYNFTDVGQDKNRMVGAQQYGESMVSRINFASNDKVVVFTQEGFYVYKDMKRPEESKKVILKNNIKSMAMDEENIALVEESKSDKSLLHIYDTSGSEKKSMDISYQYDRLYLYDGELIFFGGQKCNILRVNGREKFDYTFKRAVEEFLPSEGNGYYYIVDKDSLQQIRLSSSDGES